ncbi:MAG: M1 family aminopeptidase [Verrucomicrobiales bacterium]
MSRSLLPLLTALAVVLPDPTATAGAAEAFHCGCAKHLLFPAPVGNKPGRKYARDRRIDVAHLRLEVTPDFASRTIRGSAALTFSPIARPLPELRLDAVDLRIAKVAATGAALAEHQVTDDELVLTFRDPIPPGATATVTVDYSAAPERGLYFRTPEMGYPVGDTQLWTQGEPELHRFWFPGYDYPNERFTSEIVCHAPENMEVISNGVLAGRSKRPDGLVTTHWRQEQPHVNYLVALAVGHFTKLEDSIDGLPLAVFVPPSNAAQAGNTFLDTKKVLTYFQREIGVPFPWAKYYQVYCHDFLAGGMENTSATFMAERLIFPTETEQLDTLHWLDAHETAHQWFGNLVTCRDWAHLWLNEGFASFYTLLYEAEKFGPDGFAQGLWNEAQEVFNSAPDTKPIVWRDYTDPMHQFDYRAYPKGAWVLHMLRSQLGPDLFREGIKTYLTRHRDGIVTTDDLQQALEDVSGLSFDRFFDQWVYHGGFPELAVEYAWEADTKMARLTVRQTQSVTPQVPVFHFPLPIRFSLPGGQSRDTTLEIKATSEDFYVALPSAPDLVRIDPAFTVLAKLAFSPPGDMADRQLTQADMLGRLFAVQSLSGNKDDASVQKLAGVLANDTFWFVRQEAVKALRKIATPAAHDALLAAPHQPDARVRIEWVHALGSIFTPQAAARLSRLTTEEKNPEILGAALAAHGTHPAGSPADFLTRDSYRQLVTFAAIQSLRARDEQSAAPAVLARLQAIRTPPPGAPAPRSNDFAAAFDALAFLAREQPDRSATFNFLASHLTDPREELRAAAAKALGTLGDQRARAPLTALTAVRKPHTDPVRTAADASLARLSSLQSGSPEIQDLVQRLQEQQKRLEEMNEKLQKLEKKAAPAN